MNLQTSFIEEGLKMPNVYLAMQQIHAQLQKEQQQRQYFYDIIDENKKMEFINGEIIFHSPVKKRHNLATKMLDRVLSLYVDILDLGFVGIEKILISLTRNDYEPDLVYFDRTKDLDLHPDQMRFPAPNFVAEVLSKSTEIIDRTVKMQDYAAHGISEYWIIDPEKETVEQYILNTNTQTYELQLKATEGHIHSTAIEGFVIPIKAIFDKQVNLDTINEIIEKNSKDKV